VPVMKTRNALGLIVAGTLVVGAGTGSTLALWHDSAVAAASTTTAGTISVTVNGSTTATIAGPTNLSPGVAKTTTATLTNASAVAPNMRMQMYIDKATVTGAGLDGAIEVAATAVATTGACTAATTGYQTIAGPGGINVGQVTTTALASQASTVLCLSVRLKSTAPAGARGKSGSIVLTLRGQQVRG
jgi:hypothetical protein